MTKVFNTALVDEVIINDNNGNSYKLLPMNGKNQIPRPSGRGMLFSRGGCTQGFNIFLTALKGGVLNPFGTNKTGKSPFEDIKRIKLGITTQEIVELLRESRAGI